MLPTADHKVAIDTSTDIERVVVASIDHHSTECQRKLNVCRPRCRPCDSTEGRLRCRSSVDRGSIEVSIASINRHSIAGVKSTHDPAFLLFLPLSNCMPVLFVAIIHFPEGGHLKRVELYTVNILSAERLRG